MAWQQMLVWYAASGVAAFVAIMLFIHYVEAESAAGVVQKMRENIGRWAEDIEQKNPSRLRWLKNASGKWVAQLGVALLVILIWPVTIAWKAWIWISLYRETEAKRREVRDGVRKHGVPLLEASELTQEERIYILRHGAEGQWLWQVPEFADLALPAGDLILMLLIGAGEGIVVDQPYDLLTFSDAEVAKFCEVNKLSLRAKERLARWRNWHASAEAKAIVEFFQQKSAEKNKAA